MRQSASNSQYVIPPPEFLPTTIRRYTGSVLGQLTEWAKNEHKARLIYCAKHGYLKEWVRLNNEYSPIRVLAELSGLRRICSLLNDIQWNRLTKKEKDFIIAAFRLREHLFRLS